MNLDDLLKRFNYEKFGALLPVRYRPPIVTSMEEVERKTNVNFRHLIAYTYPSNSFLDEIEGYSYRTADMWRFPKDLARVNILVAPSYSMPSKSHGVVISMFDTLLDYTLDVTEGTRKNQRQLHKREATKLSRYINNVCRMIHHGEEEHLDRTIGEDLDRISNHVFLTLSFCFDITYGELYTDHLMGKIGKEVA